MPDYHEIYAHHAAGYDVLVSHEDHEGNIARTLFDIVPGHALDVVETGAGTGRITRTIAPRARRIDAFDQSSAMIAFAERRLAHLTAIHWGVATHDALPVGDACADLAIEGWAFGHAVGWNPGGWRDDLRRWVAELDRAVRRGGKLVLLETMGTGVAAPFEGGHALEPFDVFVREELGFSHRAIRTDYAFPTVEEAAVSAAFFFGDRLERRVRQNQWTVIPEHTGVYWRAARERGGAAR